MSPISRLRGDGSPRPLHVVVTGAGGFLGWHVCCRLRARTDLEVVPINRAAFGGLAAAVDQADVVLHLAGVNRGDTDVVRAGNVALAVEVADAVRRARQPPRIVYANSVQAGNGTAYGDGKEAAAAVLQTAATETGASFVDVQLPNLFGEHGRPDYNSFVATFCRDVLAGRPPPVQDRELSLVHAQDAAATLIDAAGSEGATRVMRPAGVETSVAEVLAALQGFHDHYRRSDIPPLHTQFDTDLFNTYRSAGFPANSPLALPHRSDARGSLVECVRAHGGSGQTFISTTAPGVTRGEHFHLRKIERFVVVQGEAQIALRRMFTEEVVRFDVSGGDLVAVDMLTMWAHNITNVGSTELMTLFWTDSVFDPAQADTTSEPVDGAQRTLERVS